MRTSDNAEGLGAGAKVLSAHMMNCLLTRFVQDRLDAGGWASLQVAYQHSEMLHLSG
jgi:hypothetical protein